MGKTAAEALIWRHRFDCRRNALHSIAQALIIRPNQWSAVKDVIDRLLKEKQVDAYTAYPSSNVYGTFVKKIQVQIDGKNPKTGEIIPPSEIELFLNLLTDRRRETQKAS